MKTKILYAVLALSTSAVCFADENWIDLLPADSLEEWTGDRALWRLDDGVLIGEALDGAPILRTTYMFHSLVALDFVLEAEIRLSGGNSGIQYRSAVSADGTAVGYQADLDATNEYSGILYEQGGRGILGRRGVITHADASGGTSVAPLGIDGAAATAHRPGEWTRYRVIAVGDYVRHEINGIPTCEVVDASTSALRRGRFAIQLHQGDPMKVEVRALRVRLLEPRVEPIEPAAFEAENRAPLTPLPTPPPTVLAPTPDSSGDPASPHWIWSSATPKDAERVIFGVTVHLPKPVRAVRGVVTADNLFQLSLGGTRVAEGSDWSTPASIELGGLPKGPIELRADVENEGGPAGFALRLTFEYSDGSSATLVTDGRWNALAGETWAAVHDFGVVAEDTPPWGDVFRERIAADPAAWELPHGFTAELLHSARPGEGSWAAFAIEAPGRFIISPESGALLRVILPEQPSDPVVTEPIAEGIGNAQGLCFAHSALFVHVTDTPERGGGLWRLEDSDQDGFYESKQQLGSYGVRNEHGAHGIALGRDGWLYLAIGNHVPTPVEFSPTDPYRNFKEDILLPRIEDPNGHAQGLRAPAGQIVRVRPDGTSWERVAGGFRNAYDLAFHHDDELFTYDADMEWDIGAPWYRAPRVIHVTSGAEIGWRSGTGKWPDGIPDAVPPVVETDLSSPTGVASGLGGNFPGRWGQALFIGDWAFGRILAVHLQEDGASWRGAVEPFCRGTPMNVTDLAFGPDGALYLTTGGRGTQSGLYRIRAADRELAGKGKSPAALDEGGNAARLRRRSLEALHRVTDPTRLDEVWACLGDSDRAIRDAARIALERMPVELWRERVNHHALAPENPARLRTAFLALARVGDDLDRESIADHLMHLPRPSSAEVERIELRTAALLVARSREITSRLRTPLLIRFDSNFPKGDFSRDRLAAELLARLAAPHLLERLLGAWEQTDRPAEWLHYAAIIRIVEEAWTPELRLRLASQLERLGGHEGGHSLRGYVTQISAAVRERAGAPAAPPAPAVEITIPPRVNEWSEAKLVALANSPARTDDSERAKRAFEKALCSHCHRRQGKWGGIGPDLTGSAGRYTAADLVRAIIDPSRDISTQYEWTEIETEDDLVLGRLIGENARHFELNTNAFGYERTTMEKERVVRREPSPISPMPPGLLDALTDVEAGALLRWLREKDGR